MLLFTFNPNIWEAEASKFQFETSLADLIGYIAGWLQPFGALLNNLWRMEPELKSKQTYFTRFPRATGAKKLEEKAFIMGKVKIRYLKIII